MTSILLHAVLLLLFLVCAPGAAIAATLFVDTAAASGGDGSAQRPFRTLQAAQEGSAPGDTLVIARGSGVYEGGIELQEKQTLIAAAEPANAAAPLIVNSSRSAVVMKSGSTVAGVRVRAKEHPAIAGAGIEGATIRDVSIELAGAARGLVFVKAAAVTVRDAKVAWGSSSGKAQSAESCGAAIAGEPLVCGAAVQLHAVEGATFERVTIEDSTRNGIVAAGVRDLTLSAVQIRGAGDENQEHGVALTNLSGTLRIDNSQFDRNESRQLHLVQQRGEVAVEIRGASFRGNAPPNGEQALLIQTSGDARLDLAVDGSTFAEQFGNALQLVAEGTSVVDADIGGNTFRKSAAAVAASAGGAAKLTYRIAKNTIERSASTAVNVHATTTESVSGEIVDNVIGVSGKSGSGAVCGGGCSGISVTAIGRGISNAVIARNTIQQTDAHGILARAGGDATLNVRITGNTVREPAGSDSMHAIAVVAGTRKTDRAAVCAEVGGEGALVNTVSGAWNVAGGGAAIALTRRAETGSLAVARYAGQLASTEALSKFVAGRNRGAAVEAAVGGGVRLSDGCLPR